MKNTISGLFIVSLLITVGIVAGGSIVTGPVEGGPSRAFGEELTIEATVAFNGPLGLVVVMDIYIHELILNGSLLSSDEIRSMYDLDPDTTEKMIREELWGRAVNLTGDSFQGDSFEVASGELDLATVDNSTAAPGDPILYSMIVEGRTEISRYLDPYRASLIDEEREDYFITALFLSGFRFTRTVSLVAMEGDHITYRIPDTLDAIGDGTILLEVRNDEYSPIDGHYQIAVDGSVGYAETYFSLEMRYPSTGLPTDESISGQMVVDWKELDTVGVTGDIDISSIDSTRSSLLTSAPESMTVPQFVPASFIGYSHLERILTEDDIIEIEDQLKSEVEGTLRTALEDDTVEGVVEVDTGSSGMTLPTTGTDLIDLIGADTPVKASLVTEKDSVLEILEGHERDDVLGLINGGLRIYHELDQITDERFDVDIRLPENLYFKGDTPIGTEGGRNIYDYIPGMKLISSDLAPEIESESLSISGHIDLSQIRTWIVVDIEMDVEANLTFGLGALKFDQDEIDLTTELEYELDYLTSDLIRLLMDMDIIDREEIEDKVEGDLTDAFGEVLPDKEDSFVIDLVDESLDFDGDIRNVDGTDHILLNIAVSGTIDPMNDLRNIDEGNETENQILPFHLDPILPFYKFERSIDLKDSKGWDLDLKISVPSGLGLKAWTGKEDQEKVKELEVDTSEGYPTIHIDIRPGEADQITIQVEIGSYLFINNIGACFGCCILGTVLILLIFLLIILKIAKKRKRNKEEAEGMTGEGEEGEGKAEEGGKKDKDGKKGEKGKPRKGKDRGKNGSGEEDLSWDI